MKKNKLFILLFILPFFTINAETVIPFISVEEAAERQLDRKFFHVKDPLFRSDEAFFADDKKGKIDWQRVPRDGYSFGHVTEPIWLKLNLYNPGEDSRFYIPFIYGLADKIKILIQEKNYSYASGMKVPAETRVVRGSNHYLPFTIDNNEKLTIYIRVDTRYNFFSSSFLLHEKNLFSYYLKNNIPAFAFFGMSLFIVIQSLFHFFNSRKRIHLYFSGYVLFYVFFQIAALAYGHIFLFDHYLLNQVVMHSACEIAAIFNVFFIIHLFEMDNELPRIANFYRKASWLALGGIVFYFTGLEAYTRIYNSIFITILFVSYYGVAFYFFKSKQHTSVVFLIAWSLGMAGIFLQSLINLGIAPLKVSFIHLTLYGSMLELAGIAWLIPSTGKFTVYTKIIPDVVKQPSEKPAPVNFRLGEINQQFRDLMEIDRLYLDWELEAEQIAKKIAIPNSHLAYYLNECLKTSFRDLLNQYRVRFACDLLENCMDNSVLKIAYESGFKSKATFNRVFKEITGFTPQEYRGKFCNNTN